MTGVHFDGACDLLTSVEPGSIPSLALRRAPLASCISLIFDPPLPMTEPILELGIINLMVTALLPGTDALSKGSSLILRTMRPNAYGIRRLEVRDVGGRKGETGHGRTLETASRGPLTLRMRSGLPGILSETMTRAPLFSLISFT